MTECHKPNCNQLITNHHYLCDDHYTELILTQKNEKDKLVNNRLKDPFYIEDTLLFLQCTKTLIPIIEDDEDDEDEEEQKFWMDHHMHELLFDEYYDQELSRTNLLIKEIKDLHKACCEIEDGFENLNYQINRYKCYTQFLVQWIEGSKIIEKNNLIKELDMVYDLQTVVQNIITKL